MEGRLECDLRGVMGRSGDFLAALIEDGTVVS